MKIEKQFTIPVVISLILSFVILFLPKFLPKRLPLFYSLPWGETQLAGIKQFFIMPAILLGFCLINLFFYRQLHLKQILLKQILFFTAILCDIILSLTLLRIILAFV